MSAGHLDLVIEKGATFSKILTWKDSEGSLVNLTGYTARMKVKESYSSSSAILDLTTENSKISLGGANGTITITVSATDTAALTANMNLKEIISELYVYDLELISGSTVTRLLQGNVYVSEEVTT